LTETGSQEYVLGIGYRIKNFELNFFSGGRGKKVSSDLDLKLDFNIMNNKTIIRKVIEDVEQITMGQQLIKIKFLSKIHFFIGQQNYPAKVNLKLKPKFEIELGKVVETKGLVIALS
jgi:hypothetical protein